MKKRAFVSHITEDHAIAARLKTAITRDFLGQLNVFVSSDTASIGAGEQWLRSIEDALHDCALFIVVCSPESVTMPWINFESGAAWMKNVPIVPVCHNGMQPRGLPAPLSFRQAVEVGDPRGLERLYRQIAVVLGCDAPVRDFTELAAEMSANAAVAVPLSDQVMRRRLDEALNHPKYPWRSIERVATAAAVSLEVATALLRADDRVRFSKSKRSGGIIVGPKSRVSER